MLSHQLRVDRGRLWASLMKMAEVGALPGGGCRRLALSAEDKAGRDLFVTWCRESGCIVGVDAVGNIFARRPGRNSHLPAVATGSHLDTQPNGGKFDGVYGVLAGLEVVRALNDATVETDAPVDVVVWTNEEGARFAPPLTGSGVFKGQYELADVYSRRASDDCSTVRDNLLRTGYLGPEAPGTRSFSCFLEAHIEQGPVLESSGVGIGIVTGVQGIRWLEAQVTGQDAHAGTVPTAMRKDAMVAAADIIVALHTRLASKDEATRLTVGRLFVSPNSPATIPGLVRFNIDVRHPSAEHLASLVVAIESIAERIAARRRVAIAISELMSVPPVRFDQGVADTIRTAASNLRYLHRDMLSGAGHDAMNIAARAPTGMIFVPCRGGLSHNEAEYASPADLAAGADVLLHAIVMRAGVAPSHQPHALIESSSHAQRR